MTIKVVDANPSSHLNNQSKRIRLKCNSFLNLQPISRWPARDNDDNQLSSS